MNNIKFVELSRGFYSFVDDEDFEKISKISWYYAPKHTNSYALGRIRKNNKWIGTSMHRHILRVAKGSFVDHINGNGLDNRKCNLRICTLSNNQWNRRKLKGKYSKYKGVTFDKTVGTWQATLMVNYKRVFSRRFKTQEAAAEAYNKKALEMFGEYACLNKIEYL